MWVLKLKFWHENSTAIPYAVKHNITIMGFPLNKHEKNKLISMTVAHLVLGEEENKKAYFKEILKSKRFKNVELEGDFLIYELEFPKGETHHQLYLTPEIMFIKPVIVKPDGFEYLEIASWNKKPLTNFLQKCKKWLKIESFSLKQQKISDVYIPHLMPKLSLKQRKAILTAYQHGYYDYPKKTNIAKLAKILGLSPSTFQEHLRRAEEKLLPFLLENLSH
jgi:predicted DNA binding protein